MWLVVPLFWNYVRNISPFSFDAFYEVLLAPLIEHFVNLHRPEVYGFPLRLRLLVFQNFLRSCCSEESEEFKHTTLLSFPKSYLRNHLTVVITGA